MAKKYRPADVCRLLELQPYVLRYWATEFPMLSTAGGGAQSTYDESDLAKLRRIKRLLYEEGYTIAGARKKLENDPPGLEDDDGGGEMFEAVDADSGGDEVRLDTPNDERIETLRRGIAEALSEAREILERIDRER